MLDEGENIERISTKKIALGTIFGYAALILSVVSGIFFTPWIKKSIGNSMYGIYTLAISIINLFLMDFGLGNSINAYLSKYRAEGNIKDEKSFLTATLKIFLLLDLVLFVVFLAAYFLIEYIYAGLTPEEIPILKNVFIILIGVSLITFPSSIYTGIMKAYEDFAPIKAIGIINKLTYIALTTISLFFNLGVYAVVLAYAASSLVNALLLYFFVRLKLKKKISLKEKIPFEQYKQIASFSGYGFLAAIAARLFFTITPSILGVVSDSTNIAAFGVCTSLEEYVFSFSAVMNGFFMPKIVRLTKNDSNSSGEKLDALAIKVGKIQTAFILLLFLGFVSCGSFFVDFWMDYDPAYDSVYLGTILLITFHIVNVSQTIYSTAMSANKVTMKPYAIVLLSVGILNIALCFPLAYWLGSLGACLSIFISQTVELVLLNALYKKYLNSNLKRFFVKTYLGFVPAFTLGLTEALLFHFFLPFSSIYNFLISGVSTVITYALLFWIGFGPKETKNFITKAAKKLKSKRKVDR